MKFKQYMLKVFCSLWIFTLPISTNANADTCSGKFFNPITDVCWSCMFPLYVAPLPTKIGYQGQKGSIAPEKSSIQAAVGTKVFPSGICMCPSHLMPIGLLMSYQEPRRMVDVTKDPFCLVGLGGISLGGLQDVLPAPGYGDEPTHGLQTRSTFYQSHWYIAPLLAILEIFDDVACTQGEAADIDIAFLSEVDPAWNDDDISFIFSPEEVLFTSLPAQLACTTDCVASSLPYTPPGGRIGKLALDTSMDYFMITPHADNITNTGSSVNPSRYLFWCGGCQGSMYPLNGNNIDAHHEIQSSVLTSQKANMLIHRMGLEMTTTGALGMCANVIPDMFMDKSEWKYQMTYPLPQTLNPASVTGSCCNAFGETDSTWNSGASFPINGENFSYFWFHERDCCML